MRDTSHSLYESLLTLPPRLTVSEWAAQNVDFSRVPGYDTDLHVPFDPEYIPQWKEVAENDIDPNIRECWVLKPSRAGASEAIILNAIRYHVACDPQHILYVTADVKLTEAFMEERIKRGLKATAVTEERYAHARAREDWIDFGDMRLTATWGSNAGAYKSFGWSRIYLDEWSMTKTASAIPLMMRKRQTTYSFGYICGMSSMDPTVRRPSSHDPILVEFKKGDMREWMMPDPGARGEWFKFEMGERTGLYGLKWDPKAEVRDGEWDLERVRESAYYVTPGGTTITEQHRMALVRTGKWIPQNPDAPAWRRSYHLNTMSLPFETLGDVACAFIEATHSIGGELKAFVYEYLAEEWQDEVSRTEEDELRAHEADPPYKKGERVSEVPPWQDIFIQKPTAVIVTADLQKGYHWCVAREWIDGGDSGLIDYGYGVVLEDLLAFEQKYEAAFVYLDARYRRLEAFEAAFYNKWVPTMGSGKLQMTYQQRVLDPFEGTRGQGEHSILTYSFNDDAIKRLLQDMIMNQSRKQWMLYKGTENEYIRQVASEEEVNGEWAKRRGHPLNHIWDCEVLQLLAAIIQKFYYSEWLARE